MPDDGPSEEAILSMIMAIDAAVPDPVAVLPEPPWADRALAWVQRGVGWLLLLPFAGFLLGLMRFWRGYRIEELQELRREYRALTRDKTPLLICANHLTFIDSALLIWAFGANHWYLLRFRAFSWNLPAGDFFKKKLHFRLVAFLSKCVFIHRDGSREHKNNVLALCRYWLLRGDVVSLFPEGRRSRTGRFDRERITYGVGKLLAATPGCRVLCVYLRGDRQAGFSNYPPAGSRFRLLTKLIHPTSDRPGREAYAELAHQVAGTLEGLEHRYIATYGPLPVPPPRPVALVTGASSGIGAALARELAGSGHDLVVVARDRERLQRLGDECRQRFGSQVHVLAQDLAAPGAAASIAERLGAEGIVVDTLVNNAGFAVHGKFVDTPLASELGLVATQLAAAVELTKAALPAMLERGRGNVLTVGSVYAYAPVPQQAVYAACKAFLLSFSEAVAAETKGSGVRVVTVCPGVTRTEFRARAGLVDKEGSGQSAEAVAKHALRALKGRETVSIPGNVNRLFVAVARALPGRYLTALMNVINGARGVNA